MRADQRWLEPLTKFFASLQFADAEAMAKAVDKNIQLDLGHKGVFYIELSNNTLLFALVQKVPEYDVEKAMEDSLLALANSLHDGLQPQVALRGQNDLIVAIQLGEAMITEKYLKAAFEKCMHLMDTAAS